MTPQTLDHVLTHQLLVNQLCELILDLEVLNMVLL